MDTSASASVPSEEKIRGRQIMAVSGNGDLGFEASLFKAADKLRGSMEPSDYKHVALA